MNLYLQNRKRLTDIENELTVAGEMDGGKGQRVRDGNVHTAIFKMDNKHGPTLQHMELFSLLCGRLYRRGVWGRMDSCICMNESLSCSPETIRTLLIGYSLIQNKNLKKIQTVLQRYLLLIIKIYILIQSYEAHYYGALKANKLFILANNQIRRKADLKPIYFPNPVR